MEYASIEREIRIDASPEVVGVPPEIVATLGHRRAGGLCPAVHDDAGRLAFRVRVDDPHDERVAARSIRH